MKKYLKFRTPLHNSMFIWKCKQMMADGYDVQMVIRAKNAKRGPGKTTLALKLARILDPEWTAKEFGVMDIVDYYRLYDDPAKSRGHTIVYDEIEMDADNRSSMSKDNKSLSHSWMILRSRQVNTIVTLPTTTTLDKRLIELSDFDIIVMQRGQAIVLESEQNIYTGSTWRYPVGSKMEHFVRMKLAQLSKYNYFIPENHRGLEVIHWSHLDGTEDYSGMESMKNKKASEWLQSEISRKKEEAKKAKK